MATRNHLDDDDDFGGDFAENNTSTRSGTKRSFGDLDDDEDDIFGSKKGNVKVEETAPGVATGMILSLRESLQNCKDTLTTCQTARIGYEAKERNRCLSDQLGKTMLVLKEEQKQRSRADIKIEDLSRELSELKEEIDLLRDRNGELGSSVEKMESLKKRNAELEGVAHLAPALQKAEDEIKALKFEKEQLTQEVRDGKKLCQDRLVDNAVFNVELTEVKSLLRKSRKESATLTKRCQVVADEATLKTTCNLYQEWKKGDTGHWDVATVVANYQLLKDYLETIKTGDDLDLLDDDEDENEGRETSDVRTDSNPVPSTPRFSTDLEDSIRHVSDSDNED